MATQRITIAKIGGAAADVIVRQLREWAAARQSTNPNEWSSDQWPETVREQADDWSDRLPLAMHWFPR